MTNSSAAVATVRTALIVLALVFSAPLLAEQIFTVDSTLDQIDDDVSDGICHTAAGTCTLRAAIMQANRTTGAGATIILPAGVYTLTRPRTPTGGELDGDLERTTPASGSPVIRIVGAGRSTTIIDAAQIDRVFHVGSLRTAIISRATIRNGYTIENGGGLLVYGALTLDDVIVSGNRAMQGGGVCNSGGGRVLIKRSIVSSNIASEGGGVLSDGFGLDIEDSTIAGNGASRAAGGISAYDPMRMSGSAVIFNTANMAGGLMISRRATITNSTVVGNEAVTDGGGIFSSNETVGVYNSTIAGNMANSDPSPDWWGSGGGIFVYGGTLNLRNTLVASNYTGGGADPDDCSGAVKSYGRNLLGETERCTISTMTGSWDLLSWNSFGNLGDNGGPTPTLALNAGSNAVDAGTLDGGCRDDTGPLPTDQRGFPRVGPCDVGAFEYGAFDPERIFRNGFE